MRPGSKMTQPTKQELRDSLSHEHEARIEAEAEARAFERVLDKALRPEVAAEPKSDRHLRSV